MWGWGLQALGASPDLSPFLTGQIPEHHGGSSFPHLCNGHSLLCAQLGNRRLLSQQLDTRCPSCRLGNLGYMVSPPCFSPASSLEHTGLGLSTSPAALKVPEGKVCLLPVSPLGLPRPEA